MSTATTLITRAYRLLGELEPGDTPDDDELSIGLESLNAMLGVWNNKIAMCYATRDESITISATNASKTVGPTGDLVTTRPVEITAAYSLVDGVSYPVRILTDKQYAAIPNKTTTGPWPTDIYYKPIMPDGVVYLYPVADASSALHVITRTPLTAFALTDTVSLPPGWEDALATNLAVRLGPELQVPVPPGVQAMATEAKASIKSVNSQPVLADSGLVGLVGSGSSGNILTGP